MKNNELTGITDKSDFVQIRVHITTGDKDLNSAHINFPTTTEELCATLKTNNIKDCKINSVLCDEIPTLSHYVGYSGNDTTINELQYISTLISSLTSNERDTFSAFLEVQYTDTDEIITAQHVMDALENLDTVNLDTTIKTDEDIGNKWLNDAMEGCQPTIDRLSTSAEQSDKNFVRFVQLLNENFDIAAYGRKLCVDNDMYPTSKGVVSVDWSAFFWREDRQVPDEIKLPDRIKPSILKQVEKNKSKIEQSDHSGKQKKKEANSIGD